MTDEVEGIEEDPFHALGRAAASSAKKDDLTTSALKMFTLSWRIALAVIVVLLLGLSLVGYWVHDINTRGQHSTPLLVCIASSQRTLAKDLRTAVTAHHELPPSAIAIPAGCQIVQ